MPKKTIRDQVIEVELFVVKAHPNWVSFREVMFHLNCGSTKAQILCKMAVDLNELFEYQNGDIRYTSDPNDWLLENKKENS